MTSGIMGSILAKSAIADFGIQWVLFVVAAALKTEKFYDLAGSGTFLFLACQSLAWGERYFLRQKIQTGMVITWALRLGSFLASRALAEGDRRFDQIKQSPQRFFVAWTLQGMWVFLTLLPTLILNSKKQDKALTTRDYVGWSLWVAGFLIEVISDRQKSAFRANPDNAGKFINTGLWSISRHPNYFGEMMLWTGLFISASSVMSGWEHASIISPIFVTLLISKVSGIPMLEKSAMKRWGSDANYLQYVRDTAVLVPYLW